MNGIRCELKFEAQGLWKPPLRGLENCFGNDFHEIFNTFRGRGRFYGTIFGNEYPPFSFHEL
jgi:hypothetical protein